MESFVLKIQLIKPRHTFSHWWCMITCNQIAILFTLQDDWFGISIRLPWNTWGQTSSHDWFIRQSPCLLTSDPGCFTQDRHYRLTVTQCSLCPLACWPPAVFTVLTFMCVLEAAQSNLACTVSALTLPYQNTGHWGFFSCNLSITGVQKTLLMSQNPCLISSFAILSP